MNKSITLLGVNSMLKKLLAFVCLTLSFSVSAAPVEYTVTGEMTGTFTFDLTTNAYSDVRLSAPTALGPGIWTLSEFILLTLPELCLPSQCSVGIEYADSGQLDLSFLTLAFDPFLSPFAPSQVSWYQDVGASAGLPTTSGTSVATPAGCTQEDYVLLTQAEVDAFPQDCVSVGGSIDIVSSADITNVDSLSNVTSVGGYLKIKHNDALINLDGLSGLTSVGGYLKIKYNNVLTHCQGLAPVLGWPSGPPNDSVGEGISIFSNGGTECDSVAAILASVSGPTQPVINTATGRDQSISLAFSPSITPDVLFPISDYEAVCSGLTEIETAQGVGSPLSVGNLTNYREYDCTVAPVTRLGTLPLSSSVSAIAGPVPPSAPQITSIDPGSAEVSINVSVADDGGSPIRFYDAYCLDDSNIYQGSSLTSPITVSGLTPGETYVCLATATNDVGTSSLSAFSAAVIPEGPADTDADGVPDLIDNCVSIPNADQEPSFVPGCGEACVTSSCAGTFCVNR